MMRWIAAMALGLVAACSNDPVCTHLESASGHLRGAGTPCGKQGSDGAFDDAEACDTVIGRCQDIDKQALENIADCFDRVATCDPTTDSNEGGFLASKYDDAIVSCAFKGIGIGDECREAFDSIKPTHPVSDAGPDDAGTQDGADAGSGADAGFTPHVFAWGEATVRDRTTGILWERSAKTALTYQQSVAWCEARVLGLGEWRLPTITELKTLIAPGTPAINTEAFPDGAAQAWSATTGQPGGGRPGAWYVDFVTGMADDTSADSRFQARCVLIE